MPRQLGIIFSVVLVALGTSSCFHNTDADEAIGRALDTSSDAIARAIDHDPPPAGFAIKDVLPDPDVQQKSTQMGMEMRASTPEEMTGRMKADIAKWGAVIEKAGIPRHE